MPAQRETEKTFLIHNTVRRAETRSKRAQSPGRRMNLHLGGDMVRVVRGKSAPVTESTLKVLLRELIQLEKDGYCFVTDANLRRVNLETMEVGKEIVDVKALPQEHDDSVMNDKNEGVGHAFPQHQGGHLEQSNPTVPTLVQQAKEEGAAPAETDLATPSVEQPVPAAAVPPTEDVAVSETSTATKEEVKEEKTPATPALLEKKSGGKQGKK